MTKKKKGYWTEEEIREIAKGFRGRGQFHRKFGGAYRAAKKFGILEEIFPEILPSHPITLTKDLFLVIAKRYNSLRIFNQENRSLASKAYKEGWFKEAPWLEKNSGIDLEKRLWCIYVYEIKETGHAYVGLTRAFKDRDNQHKKNTKKGDILFEYCTSLGIPVPDPIVLEENLTGEEAQESEKRYVDQYRGEGWKMVNSAKPGSLGGGIRKWTLESCIEECRVVYCEHELPRGVFEAIKRNGWKEECYSHFLPKIVLYKISPQGFVVRGYKFFQDAAKDLRVDRKLLREYIRSGILFKGFYWKTAETLFAD